MKADKMNRSGLPGRTRALSLSLAVTVAAAAGVLSPATAQDKKPPKSRRVQALAEPSSVVQLTNGTGDARATVEVDSFGSFGDSLYGEGLVYDPVGPVEANSTTYDSALWFSGRDNAGVGGEGEFLTGGEFYGEPLVAPFFSSVTESQAVSTFTRDNIRFDLTQEMLPATDKGSVFRQTYVLTNQGAATSIDLLRTIDGDLDFDDTNNDRAGVSLDGQTLFEFDNGEDPTNATTFVGIDMNGQANLGYRVAAFNFKDDVFENGREVLNNTLTQESGANADVDGDGLTDVAYDITMTQGRTLTLAPGASVTVVVNTRLGEGRPAEQLGADVDLTGPTGPVAAGDTVCYNAAVTGGGGAPVPNTNVLFTVAGNTGNVDTGVVTTNSNGEAQFCFQSLFPGVFTVTACLDTNSNGVCDPSEPSSSVTGTAVLPVNTIRGTANGTGAVNASGGLGRFNFTVLGTTRDLANGQVRFTAPAAGETPAINARSQRINSVRFSGGPGNRVVEILGTARVPGFGIVPFRIDAADRTQAGGGDTFVIRFLRDLNGDGTPESLTYGGSLVRVPGGRSDVVVRAATTPAPN